MGQLLTHASLSSARTVLMTSFGGSSSGSLAALSCALSADSTSPCAVEFFPRRFIWVGERALLATISSAAAEAAALQRRLLAHGCRGGASYVQ